MRICIVSGTFPPEIGGPPTYLAQLIPELAARGHQVHVVTFGETVPLDLPCTVKRVSRRLSIPRRLLNLTAAVLHGTQSADLLFVSDYGLPPAIVNRLRGLPMAIKIVGDFAWEYSVRHHHIPHGVGIDAFQTLAGSPIVRLLKRVQRTYVDAADRVIVPSDYLRGLVTGWGVTSTKVRVVHNAVPVPGQQACLTADPPTIVTVARLAPWKGIDTLVQALSQTRCDDARLVVAGDGEDRPRLEALAEREAPGRVDFLGAISRTQVEEQMMQASALALASGYEGLSHVLLEGLACGLPIIASDIQGNREIVTPGINGWLATPGDVAGFRDAIDACLGDPEQARMMGARNRAWAQEHSVAHQVDRTMAVFLEAVEARRH